VKDDTPPIGPDEKGITDESEGIVRCTADEKKVFPPCSSALLPFPPDSNCGDWDRKGGVGRVGEARSTSASVDAEETSPDVVGRDSGAAEGLDAADSKKEGCLESSSGSLKNFVTVGRRD
jgi:hypothetical protein